MFVFKERNGREGEVKKKRKLMGGKGKKGRKRLLFFLSLFL